MITICGASINEKNGDLEIDYKLTDDPYHYVFAISDKEYIERIIVSHYQEIEKEGET